MIAPRLAPARARTAGSALAQQLPASRARCRGRSTRRRSRRRARAAAPASPTRAARRRRRIGFVAEPTAIGPTSGIRTSRAGPRQRKPPSSGIALTTTSRCTRAGCSAAQASPTAAPQSWQAEPHAVELERVEQAVEEAHVAGERVVEVAALAAATEAGQVDGDAAAERERGHPVEGARADAVQEDRRHRVVARATQEHRLVVELERRFGHRQHGGGLIASRPVRTLCFGDALVDLICHRHVGSIHEADAFVPSPGGVIANVAATAARARRRGVARRRRGRRPLGATGCTSGSTPPASTCAGSSSPAGTPRRSRSRPSTSSASRPGRSTATASRRASPRSTAACSTPSRRATRCCSAPTRSPTRPPPQLTMAARERALELGRPIVFDPSIRMRRWRDRPGGAAAACNACVPGAFLVKCNAGRGARHDRRGTTPRPRPRRCWPAARST